MPTLNFAQVAGVCEKLIQGTGASVSSARLVGKYLATANLYGHDSHGIQNAIAYVDLTKRGIIKPKAKWRLVRQSGATALLDGRWGIGQVVCTEATKMAIRKAKRYGTSSVGIYNCNHIGRLGDYSSMVAENGMIGVIYANCDPSVAPLGGMKSMLGTNPISYAFPRQGDRPIMVDFASAAVAEGKIRAATLRGENVPDGWIMDKDGNPTNDPKMFYAAPYPPLSTKVVGAQLPAAGHKGYGLAVAVDILGGALTGTGVDGEVREWGNGVLIQAINIKSFIPLKKYNSLVLKLAEELRDSPKAPGHSEIMIPGDPEYRMADKRSKEGIPIPDLTWKAVTSAAKDLGFDADKVVDELA
jgi:hydroxycarboxylate dehydrogenase B